MCNSSSGFKLCTCNDEASIDRKKPHWVLHRKVPRPKDDFSDFIVGEAHIDELYGSITRDNILDHLRSGECFDTDVKLKQKDRLDIYIEEICYQFELRRNGWQIYSFDFPGIEYQSISAGIVET
ncbi:hypothetical protein A3762_13790 [Oleiphilus sp. HI0125]|uniref:hypothetical protein n=1 Tax=Oleiphilus sp. HI0125 TaxID=1822266 RepID=UPI0007C22276|nr:hypothetical protein [Oleiphilus sp. HI0125]KZZ62013.1 hypothetical protein A3762_13790 [Oleiphilus sp. HI0125]